MSSSADLFSGHLQVSRLGTAAPTPSKLTWGPVTACGSSQCAVVWIGYVDYHVRKLLVARYDQGGPLDKAPTAIAEVSSSSSASVAALGDGEYMITWTGNQNAYSTRVRAVDGAVLDPVPVLLGPANAVAVASDSSAYYVARSAANSNLFVSKWTGGSFSQFNFGGAVATNVVSAPGVAAGGQRLLVAWADGRALLLDSASGQPISPGIFEYTSLLQPTLAPSVTYGAGTFLVAWLRGKIYGARVRASDGLLLDSDDMFNQIPGAIWIGSSPANIGPRATFDGTHATVIWYESGGGGARVDLSTGKRVDGKDGSTREFGFSTPSPPHAMDVSQSAGKGLVVFRYGGFWNRADGAWITSPPAITLGPTFPVCRRTSDQEVAAIASNGTGYLVVWIDSLEFEVNKNVYAVRLDAAGVPMDPVGVLLASGANYSHVAVASDGKDYFVGWTDYSNSLRVKVVKGGTGLPEGNGTTISASPKPIGIACDRERYLVTWLSPLNKVNAQRFATNGTPIDTQPVLLGVGDDYSRPSASANWTPTPDLRSFLVGYARSSTSEFQLMRGKTGAVISPATTMLGTRPSVTSDGTDFFASWESSQGGIRASRLDATSGKLLDSASSLPGISMANANGAETYPASVHDGISFLTAWSDTRNQGEGVWAARLDPAMSLLDGPPNTGGFVVAPKAFEYKSNSQRVASRGNGHSAVLYRREVFDSDEAGLRLRIRVVENDGLPAPLDSGVQDGALDSNVSDGAVVDSPTDSTVFDAGGTGGGVTSGGSGGQSSTDGGDGGNGPDAAAASGGQAGFAGAKSDDASGCGCRLDRRGASRSSALLCFMLGGLFLRRRFQSHARA